MVKALDFPILQKAVLNVPSISCSAWLYPEACVNLPVEQMSGISVPFGSPLKIICSLVKIYQIHESKFASCNEGTIISVVYFHSEPVFFLQFPGDFGSWL